MSPVNSANVSISSRVTVRGAETTWSPGAGEHTIAVLTSLGYAPDEIDDLLADRALHSAEERARVAGRADA